MKVLLKNSFEIVNLMSASRFHFYELNYTYIEIDLNSQKSNSFLKIMLMMFSEILNFSFLEYEILSIYD